MPPRTFLTVSEAADLARVPTKTIQHWIYSGQLVATVRGKHRLIREGVLVAFLEGAPAGQGTS